MADVAATLRRVLDDIEAGRPILQEVRTSLEEYAAIAGAPGAFSAQAAAFEAAHAGKFGLFGCKGVGARSAVDTLVTVHTLDGENDVIITKHVHWATKVDAAGHVTESSKGGRYMYLYGVWVRGEMLLAVPAAWSVFPYMLDAPALARRDPAARLCRLIIALASRSSAWEAEISGKGRVAGGV